MNKYYKQGITINKNKRGCYILDTVKGCELSDIYNNGCYESCYANNIANRYKYKFNHPIVRKFSKDYTPLLFKLYPYNDINGVFNYIKNNNIPFIRIGEMGDPSQYWRHTLEICNILKPSKTPIVIQTKHIKTIPVYLMKYIENLDVCISTSISGMDNENEIKHRINQYNIFKNHCKSTLRIVSCNYNIKNKEGARRAIIQDKLFYNDKTLDTIFRPRLGSRWVINNIINIEKVRFINSFVYASIFNAKTYFGLCDNCPDQCGINL